MKIELKFIYGILFIFFLTACSKKADNSNSHIVEINEIAREQQIPKALLSNLDEKFKEEFKSNPPIYVFSPIDVALYSNQPEVLKNNKYLYKFPKGGGEIDLRDVVVGSGSFYLYFPKDQFSKDQELIAAYFVSRSPQVEIEGEKFGLGCGKWTDLKGSFSKLQNPDYLKLNTNDLRYLRVAGGMFMFVFKSGKNIFLTQLSVIDSRHTDEMCVEIPSNESK